MRIIDLHTHSTYSDGSYTPAELIKLGAEIGLSALALTDHDTVSGLSEAAKAAEKADVEFVFGVELSCSYRNREIHIVGLDINIENGILEKRLEEVRLTRAARNRQMVKKMQDHGIDVKFEDFTNEIPGTAVTRAHFGHFLVNNGIARDIEEAFEKYLGVGKLFYVSREYLSPREAIELITDSGGIPILAHPLRYGFSGGELDTCVKDFKEMGIRGIEVYYSSNRGFDEITVKDLADKYDLLYSGGTDFHGLRKPDIALGTGRNNVLIPYQVLNKLREPHGKARRI